MHVLISESGSRHFTESGSRLLRNSDPDADQGFLWQTNFFDLSGSGSGFLSQIRIRYLVTHLNPDPKHWYNILIRQSRQQYQNQDYRYTGNTTKIELKPSKGPL
jgi:hypothetical protein